MKGCAGVLVSPCVVAAPTYAHPYKGPPCVLHGVQSWTACPPPINQTMHASLGRHCLSVFCSGPYQNNFTLAPVLVVLPWGFGMVAVLRERTQQIAHHRRAGQATA